MDFLKATIHTLSADEKRQFQTFLARQKNKRSRKDVDLFVILSESKDYKPTQLIQKLYPASPNREGYHALRKRLIQELTKFIWLKQTDNNNTTSSKIMGYLTLSEYLFQKKSEETAWHFVRKAEEIAQKNEQFELLNRVYLLQLEFSESEFADDTQLIIQKKASNQKLAQEDERAIIALALVRQEIRERKKSIKFKKIGEIISQILADYQLDEAVIRRPKLLHGFISAVRSVHLASKEFIDFEPFIIKKYDEIEKNGGFSKPHHFYKLRLLYMITHILYRNKKFVQAEIYLIEFYQNLTTHEQDFYPFFYLKYETLRAGILHFREKNQEAIQVCEALFYAPKHKLSVSDLLNVQLNLIVYYFTAERFKDCNKLILQINRSDKFYAEKVGMEWLLKKYLIEALTQYEIGNPDVALKILKNTKRLFANFFEEHPRFDTIRVFLNYLQQFMDERQEFGRKFFEHEVRENVILISAEAEDLQAMGFYAWLRAKVLKKSYYEVLLDTVGVKELH